MFMKGKKKGLIIAGIIVLLIIILVFVIIIANRNRNHLPKKYNVLISLEVNVAGENESNIVSLYYPYYVYTLQKGDRLANDFGGVHQRALSRSIRDTDVSKQDLYALVDCFEQIKTDPTTQMPANRTKYDYTYEVTIHYWDMKGQNIVETIYGYDSLPACWPSFTRKVNALIGEEAFDTDPTLFAFSADWMRDTFQIKDEDCEYGSIEDMIKATKLSMDAIIGRRRNWSPNHPIAQYKASFTRVPSDVMATIYASEIQTAESTEEEFHAFLEEYFSELLGENYYKIDNYLYEYMDGDELIGVTCRYGDSVTIYRSSKWQPEKSNNHDFYVYIDRSGPEGMTCEFPVFYSPDGKYVMYCGSSQKKYFIPFGIYVKEDVPKEVE